jgi:hypothetical protein
MSKHRGKAKRNRRTASWIQTKRSPKNKHRFETQAGRAKRLLQYAEFFKLKQKQDRAMSLKRF